jgi:Uma2 family endonuclease
MSINPNPPVTIEAFEAFLQRSENRDRLWELIHGRIVEKVPTEEHSVIVLNIGFFLKLYIREHKQGRAGPEMRHQRLQDDINSRLPDMSYFIDHSRPVVTEGAVPIYPDLAVEVKSPDDSYVEMRDKAHFYLAQGTRMVWLVYPAKRAMEIITADDIQWLTIMDTLTAEDILPGFSVPVAEIFQLDPSES